MTEEHPQVAWGRWFATQWGLFVVLGIVAGFEFWVARQSLMIGIAVASLAMAVGWFIGLTRLDRWLESRDEGNQESQGGRASSLFRAHRG